MIKNISKAYGKKEVIKDCSFEVFSGQVVGVLGKNGSGKTTLLKILLGFLNIQGGEILYNGKQYDASIYASGLIENPVFYNSMTGLDNLNFLLTEYERDELDYYAECFQFSEALGQKVKTYSLGMKQKLALILLLLQKRAILLLDEPSNGLDIVTKEVLCKLLRAKAQVEGTHIVIASHDIHFLEEICQSVYVLKEGGLYKSRCEKSYNFNVSFLTEEGCLMAKSELKDSCKKVNDRCLRVSPNSDEEMSAILNRIVHMGVIEVNRCKSFIYDWIKK